MRRRWQTPPRGVLGLCNLTDVLSFPRARKSGGWAEHLQGKYLVQVAWKQYQLTSLDPSAYSRNNQCQILVVKYCNFISRSCYMFPSGWQGASAPHSHPETQDNGCSTILYLHHLELVASLLPWRMPVGFSVLHPTDDSPSSQPTDEDRSHGQARLQGG